ncbi:MAG TPA: DUF4304 domain-containing protein [Capsulimonadaceae bacterium]|jgi:hypothetical protein
MDTTPNANYRKVVIARIAATLKPLGFRRKAMTFTRAQGDVLQFVNVQASTSSTADILKLTVNLAVYSEEVNQILNPGDDIGCGGWLDNHWRDRIGSLTDDRQDVWWTITNTTEAENSGNEIAALLVKSGMDVLALHSSTLDLVPRIPIRPGGYNERVVEAWLAKQDGRDISP